MSQDTIEGLSAKLRAVIVPAIQDHPPEVALPALLTVSIILTIQATGLDQMAATQLIIDQLTDAKRGAMS